MGQVIVDVDVLAVRDRPLVDALEATWRHRTSAVLRVAGGTIARLVAPPTRGFFTVVCKDVLRSANHVRRLLEKRELAVVYRGRVIAVIIRPEEYERLTGLDVEEELNEN